MKKISLLICLILSFSQTTAQLSTAQLKQDVAALRKGLEKNHPGLYWYASKQQFDSVWNKLNSTLDQPMTDDQFLKLVLPVVAKVQCAHTLFYPSKGIMSRGKRFPLSLKFFNGRAYVLSDTLSTVKIPRGSELLSINGRPAKQIIDLLLPNLQAQGGNFGWKFVILENDFQNYYYYTIEQADEFLVEYEDYGSKEKRNAKISASSDASLRVHWRGWYPAAEGPPLKITFSADGATAIITIKSLSRGRYKMYDQDFDKLLDQYFKEIKTRRIKTLILDVRGNEGGNNPEKVYARIARVGDTNIDNPNGEISPAADDFGGEVILLSNERSISAQESLVGIFKNNNRGLTIGHATPGSSNGLCGGNKRKITLPNSKFQIQIPLHASYWAFATPSQFQSGKGLPPDILIDETIDSILEGRDLAMEAALQEIKKR